MTDVTLLDGGFATQLMKKVTDKIDGHPLWGTQFLLHGKDSVIETHRDYIKVGADVIKTNTYQGSISGFMKNLGLSAEESYELLKNGVHYAKEAIKLEKEAKGIGKEKKVLVAGCIGPYGASLRDGSEYNGDYIESVDLRDVEDYHRPKFQAMTESGADILAIETIPTIKEAKILLNILREFPNQKAWLSFQCKDDCHTAHNENFVEAVTSCWKQNPTQLLAVGVNCTAPSISTRLLTPLVGSGIPLIVYPNSGESWDAIEKVWTGKEKCEPVHMYIRPWLQMGIKYIGGCCRTTPYDISLFRSIIDSY